MTIFDWIMIGFAIFLTACLSYAILGKRWRKKKIDIIEPE
jgi:hypothetical protein